MMQDNLKESGKACSAATNFVLSQRHCIVKSGKIHAMSRVAKGSLGEGGVPCEHTHREARKEPDPVGLVVGFDQLLPHVVHWHDEHGVCKGLVDDHQHNRHRPYRRLRQTVVHVACKRC